MSFTYWPASTSSTARASSDIQLWLRLIELWDACREIAGMIQGVAPNPHGGPRWPKHSQVWDRGVVTAVAEGTDGTTLVSTRNDDGTPNEWCQNGEFVNVPWICQNMGFHPSPPSSWKLVIEDCDPRRVVIVDILSWDEDTLTVNDLVPSVTERVIPSLGSLVGKEYFIIRGDYGIWWSQRIPAWPNSKVFLRGSDDGFVPTQTGSTATTLTDTTRLWTVDQWKDDYDLIFKDSGGVMRRGRITGNTATVLTFSGADGTPSADYPYYIIEREGLFQWDRVPDKPFAWYTGLTESFYNLLPDDTSGTTDKPLLQITHPVGVFCTNQDDDVWDTDLWNATDDDCSTDYPYNPWVAKSLRYIQKYLEVVCRYFIPTGSYSGIDFKPSPFSVATFLNDAGINGQTSSTGTPDALGIPVALVGAFPNTYVWYCIQDDNGCTLADGLALWDGEKLIGSFDTIIDPPDEEPYLLLEGRTIVVSLGWTRQYSWQFKHLYANDGVFIPDQDYFGSIIDPPREPDPFTTEGPGRYLSRGVSEHYIDISDNSLGKVIDGAEERDEFEDGDLALYVGDNWNDPPVFGTSYFSAATIPPLLPYYSTFWTGTHNKANGNQAAIAAQKSGTATAGANNSLTQTTHDWFNPIWYGRAVNEFTSTATGGSSTTLIDSSQAGSARWDTTKGYWNGFILEILVDGVATHKMPITGTDQVTGTLTFISDGYTVQVGDNYRIRLPRQRNRWKGRKIRLTNLDGVTHDDILITHSDDQTIWFASQAYTVAEGWSFQIIEIPTGTLMERVDGEWVPAIGLTGPARADHVIRYGKIMLGDFVCSTVLNEIIAANELLRSVFHESFGWTSRGNPDIEEKNVRQGGEGYTSGNCDFITGMKEPAEEHYAEDIPACDFPECFPPYPGQPHEVDGQTPTCTSKYDFGPDTGGCAGNAALVRVTGHGKVLVGNGDVCPLSSSTDFYVQTIAPIPQSWPEIIDPIPAEGFCNESVTISIGDPPPPYITQYYTAVFDANGDASVSYPLVCKHFILFSSSSMSYDVWAGVAEGGDHDHTGLTDRRSGKLGSFAQPNWPSKVPPNPGSTEYNSHARGWVVKDVFAITNYFRQKILPIPDGELMWWWY